MSDKTGVYLEDFHVGRTMTYGAYEVSEEEIIEFAEKYDPQPFHLDPDTAAESFLGGLCASGWHTGAITMRMMVDALGENKDGGSLGSPGVDELRWLKPVRPGDVLSVTNVVTEVRPSRSRPGVGTVHSDITVNNQNGDPVMTFKSIGFFAKRDG